MTESCRWQYDYYVLCNVEMISVFVTFVGWEAPSIGVLTLLHFAKIRSAFYSPVRVTSLQVLYLPTPIYFYSTIA